MAADGSQHGRWQRRRPQVLGRRSRFVMPCVAVCSSDSACSARSPALRRRARRAMTKMSNVTITGERRGQPGRRRVPARGRQGPVPGRRRHGAVRPLDLDRLRPPGLRANQHRRPRLGDEWRRAVPAVPARAGGRPRRRRVDRQAAVEQRARGAVRLLVFGDHGAARRRARAQAPRRGRRRASADRSLPGRRLAERALRPGVRRPVVRRPDRGAVDRDRLPAPGPRPRPAAVRDRDAADPLRRPRLLRTVGACEGQPDQGARLHLHRLGGHVQPRATCG